MLYYFPSIHLNQDTKSFKTCSFSETVKECVWSPSNLSLFLATTFSGKLISYDMNNDSKQELLPQNVSTCTWDQKGNNILVGFEDAVVSVLNYPSMNNVLTIPKPEHDPPFVKGELVVRYVLICSKICPICQHRQCIGRLQLWRRFCSTCNSCFWKGEFAKMFYF